ncbi:MAG: SDR family oxidoreductase UcpA [Peptostreptococcaceae bacterium]|nr:SDR family oxidoreductase UcpA [Peptostreptococcaceae bacterium]
MGKVNGKIAIVTGAAMGNGLGIAEILAKEGATVAMFDVNQKVFDSAKELESKGYKVMPVIADVTDSKSVKNAVDSVIKKYGRIDILVSNAGIIRVVPFLEMTDEIRDLHWNVNINGVWNCAKAVVPHMIEQKYGRIVNMSSVTGPMVADTGETAYAPSKAAIWGFTKALAIEMAPHGITVNAVCPGYVDTPMAAQIAKESNPEDPDAVKRGIAAATPLARLATIQEIGYTACFLASDEASYLTGTQIVIDGGSTLPETFGAVGTEG